MSRGYTHIGLLDHLGHGNLGDEGSLEAVIHNIKGRWPHAVIIGLSLNPFDTQKRHGIRSYAIRRDSKFPPTPHASPNGKLSLKARFKAVISKYRFLFIMLRAINTVAIRIPKNVIQEVLFLAESFRIAQSLDVLIISGGGQLLDSWGGTWAFPYTILKWVVLAKLSRAKCYFLNVGAGPLERPLSRFSVRQSLALADYASFRDERSQMLVHKTDFTQKSHVHPDCAYSLEIPAYDLCVIKSRRKGTVGLAPMPFCDPRHWPEKDQGRYTCFIRKLAMFGSCLIKNDYDVVLFCSDIGADWLAIEDIEPILRTYVQTFKPEAFESLCRVHQWTTEELLLNMSTMDYVVTCRFHGVVFAHMLTKPILAIAHHPKVSALMKDIGLSEYCVDIRDFEPDVLAHKFASLVRNSDDIRQRMADKLACYKQDLSAQFDELFPEEMR